MQCGKLYSRVATLVMLAALLLLWVSCNPYKKLGSRPPLTAKDSAALLARCVQISPLDTTSSHYSPIEPAPADSTAYFKAIADSLSKLEEYIIDSISVQYRDTCTSAKVVYRKGQSTGYEQGKIAGRSEAAEMYRRSYRTTDSLHRLAVAKLKSDYNLRLIAAANSEGTAKAQAEKYRKKYERLVKWTWGLSVAFLLAVIICIILWKFKRQARAANNIMNDVRNLK